MLARKLPESSFRGLNLRQERREPPRVVASLGGVTLAM